MGQTKEEDSTRWLSFDLGPTQQYSSEIDFEATRAMHAENPGIAANALKMKPPPPPTELGIEVRYAGRTVRISAKEIMDALEGK